MSFRRILVLAGILLILFLGMYTWNQRTRMLDDLAANVGLELTGAVLAPLRALQDSTREFWQRYFDLVNVREENRRLKTRLEDLEARLEAHGESLAELERLRQLVDLPGDPGWKPVGARVLAGRMGPNAVLSSIVINRGYVTGGRPNTPVITNKGLVGRILRASPHTANALLLTDPGSRVAVAAQTSRAFGILTGRGSGRPLEVNFVRRDASIKQGDILITAGLDQKFPKGIPAARVVSVAPSDYTQFLAVEAEPLVDLHHLEEVVLLEPTGIVRLPDEPDDAPAEFVGPPAPPKKAAP
ncbi:MAG: rod shape-determining protein MreC [Desulfovibrio sp.]|nr:rod shape-determining protein MreC [Desulfovibrio sp.]